MKIKKLADMCKRAGVFCLYDRVNSEGEVVEQWMGTYAAAYPLTGLPHLTTENLAALFDITEKQLTEKISIRHERLPEGLNYGHTDEGEVMLDREIVTLGYGGKIVRPLITRGGLEFINDDFLSPLADVADMLELYERISTVGRTYFAAKVGLMIVGVIMPMNIVDERLVDHMETLAGKCRAALAVKEERERRRDEERDGQTSLEEEG
ncbi:MAG: hypothetical protein FWF86_09345 [Clostridia bacterium]|nr:hypothetical protein [Clostridia bacterium]